MAGTSQISELSHDTPGIVAAILLIPVFNITCSVRLVPQGALVSAVILSASLYYFKVNSLTRFRTHNYFLSLTETQQITLENSLWLIVCSTSLCFRLSGPGGGLSILGLLGGLTWVIEKIKVSMLEMVKRIDVRFSDMEPVVKALVNREINKLVQAGSRGSICPIALGLICALFANAYATVFIDNTSYGYQVGICTFCAGFFLGKLYLAWLYTSLAAFYIACEIGLEEFETTVRGLVRASLE